MLRWSRQNPVDAPAAQPKLVTPDPGPGVRQPMLWAAAGTLALLVAADLWLFGLITPGADPAPLTRSAPATQPPLAASPAQPPALETATTPPSTQAASSANDSNQTADPRSRAPALPRSRAPAQSSIPSPDSLATERERARATRLARYQQALAALGVGNGAVQLEPSVALAPVLGSWQSAYAQLVNAQTPEELWEAEAALDRVERELYVLIPPRPDQSAVSAAPADRPLTQLELYRASTSSEENRARAVGGGPLPAGPPGLAGTSNGVSGASSVRAPTEPAAPVGSTLEDHPPLPAVAAERERMLRLQQRWLDKTIDALDYSGVFELEALFISNLLRQWQRHYDALKSARSLEAIDALTEPMAAIRRELERLVEGHVARQQRSTPPRRTE